MAEGAIQNFNGSQENMCEAARLGVNLYEKMQSQFQKMNGMYTKEWGESFRKEIAAALGMPDVNTRRAVPADVRNQLIPFAQDGITAWLTLSGLIISIAPEGSAENLLTIAGKANYVEAGKYKWAKVKALLTAGSEFISNNMDWLLNDGNSMSPSFPKFYNEAMNAYNGAADAFFNAKQDLPFGTTSKVDALNAVYAKLSAMFADGRKINRFNKQERDKFNYTSVLAIAQRHGIGGVRFSFFEGDTTTRISTSTAIFVPGGKVFTSNKNGVMTCHLKAGTYTCTLTTPGYDAITMEIIVRPGILSPQKINLHKIAEVAVAV